MDVPKLTGGDQGPPDPNVLPKFWRDLTDVCCGNCSDEDGLKGRRFREEMRIKRFDQLRPDNPFGKDHYYRVFVQVCVDCGQELYYVDGDVHKNSKERPSKTLI